MTCTAECMLEWVSASQHLVVKWDWKAATSVLRNVQYTKAEERFNEHRGGGKLEMPDVMGWVKGLLPSDDAGTSNFGGNTTLA